MDLEIYCAEFINIYVTNLHIFARGDTKSWGGPTQYPVNMDPPSLKLRRSYDESRAGDKVECDDPVILLFIFNWERELTSPHLWHQTDTLTVRHGKYQLSYIELSQPGSSTAERDVGIITSHQHSPLIPHQTYSNWREVGRVLNICRTVKNDSEKIRNKPYYIIYCICSFP